MQRRPPPEAKLAPAVALHPAIAPMPVPELGLDSALMPSPAQAFWAWRDVVSVIFDVALPSPQALDEFKLQFTAWHPGPLLIGRCISDPQHFRRAGSTIAKGGVDHYLVQLYLEGGYEGDADGRPMKVEAGDISVLDLARPMHSVATAFDNISVVLPRMLVAPLLKTPDDVHGIVVSGRTGGGMILADHLVSLANRMGAMQGGDMSVLASGTVALVAAGIGATPQARSLAVQEVRAALLVRIRRHIDENLASRELTQQSICDRFGLSRSSLHRLFETSGGFSHYVQERRLRRCFAEIVAPGGKRIADIGYAWGFDNESAFSRAFRRMFDVSPREARLMSQQSPGSPARAMTQGATSGNTWLADWILGLTGD